MAWAIEVQDDDGVFRPVSVIRDVECGYCHAFTRDVPMPACIQDHEEDARHIVQRLKSDQKVRARYVPAPGSLAP